MDSLLQGPVALVLPQSDIHSHSVQGFSLFTLSLSGRNGILQNQDKSNKIDQNMAENVSEIEAQAESQNKEPSDLHKPILLMNDSRLALINLSPEKNTLIRARSPSKDKEKENRENIDPRHVEELGLRRVSLQNLGSKGVLENCRLLRRVSYNHQTASQQRLKLRKPTSKPMIQDAILISKQVISFEKLIPGQSCQESIQFINKSSHNIQISIEVDLLPEFQHLEECVYSIRRHTGENSMSQYSVTLPPSSTSSFLVDVKIPFIKFIGEIKGLMRVTAQEFSDRLLVDLVCFSSIPRIICPSELYHSQIRCGVVNLAIKRGKKQETRIPFKNESDIPLVLAFGFFSAKSGNEERRHFWKISPNVAKLPSKGMGVLTLSVTNTETERKEKHEGQKKEKIHDILVCRIVESAIFYSFALSIELY